MFELLQITPAFSNAVLVAVLPFIAEFSEKLELPLAHPVTSNHVERFQCDPRRGHVGGLVVLTNCLRVWFDRGFVTAFESPRSYFALQDPAGIPGYFGSLKLDKEESLAVVAHSLQRLGYSLRELYADQPPRVTMPPRLEANVVARYRFEWLDPLEEVTSVDAEVNADDGRLEMLKISTPNAWRDPPLIGVEPVPFSPRPDPLALAPASNAVLQAALPALSEYAHTLELPVPDSLVASNVAFLGFHDSDYEVRVKLANRFWLLHHNGRPSGFIAPDSFFMRFRDEARQPVESYVGEWRLSEEEAVELARRTLVKAGCDLKHFAADKDPELVRTPKQAGEYVIPRYFIQWAIRHPTQPSTVLVMARVEVDAHARQVKALYTYDGIAERAKFE